MCFRIVKTDNNCFKECQNEDYAILNDNYTVKHRICKEHYNNLPDSDTGCTYSKEDFFIISKRIEELNKQQDELDKYLNLEHNED